VEYASEELSEGQVSNKKLRLNPQLTAKIEYMILHEVECKNIGSHVQHKHRAVYFDCPKLFAGDSKASALRGKHAVVPTDYLEAHPGVHFLVYRTFSCNKYCAEYEDDFDHLQVPNIEPHVLSTIRSHFYSLPHNGRPAIPASERVEIVSRQLRAAMETLESSYPNNFKFWTTQNALCYPYLQIFYNRNLLSELSTTPSDSLQDTQSRTIGIIFDYWKGRCAVEWNEAASLFHNGHVSLLHFAKLFEPNQLVVTFVDKQPLAYFCEGCQVVSSSILELDCWSWQYSGSFYRVRRRLTLKWPSRLSDSIEITELAIYPLKYGPESLTGLLKSRGQTFWDCRIRNFVSYAAPTTVFELRAINPRYMVDTKTYFQLHPDKSDSANNPSDLVDLQNSECPRYPFLFLLPHQIRGYGLHDKKWRLLDVDKIHPVQWNQDAFDRRLVLKSQKKELIKALVTVHLAHNNAISTDIIEGKGCGLIILLHGGPGTGKTLTAETIAEFAHKPLYRVTCGDMGTDPERVEKYLDSVLRKFDLRFT
jgi:hypothetical protein